MNNIFSGWSLINHIISDDEETTQSYHDEDSQSKNESEKSKLKIIGLLLGLLYGKPLKNADLGKETIWQDSDGTPVLSIEIKRKNK
ncbi:hypothetical protein [Lactobacillus helveticus]|uniref:hypothetical protein n=1 Tax=Lactobacillus helveticus TaxID=1587 RepID=UPI001565683B|nr:hypothetical protein [Lactobacillus helveticus]NRO92524.1 hypothetical protein [Lactobacillus helveticus]